MGTLLLLAESRIAGESKAPGTIQFAIVAGSATMSLHKVLSLCNSVTEPQCSAAISLMCKVIGLVQLGGDHFLSVRLGIRLATMRSIMN